MFLREDAFHLHEARKAYLKASLDFSVQAPHIRDSIDRLLVRVSFDQWREFKVSHEQIENIVVKSSQEMDRIRGWIHEMEGTERSSQRQLVTARNQIEESAEAAARPSRELEDYSVSSVPFPGTGATPAALETPEDVRPEKQGWVNVRLSSEKSSRPFWIRRWAFVKSGIFGCLLLGSRSGGVEETDRIGVLLCNVKPATQEERRFCFEVKTKSDSMTLQAETQKDLMEWIATFEAAKKKALENPASSDLTIAGKVKLRDPAFSISQPPAPEFAADPAESLVSRTSEEGPSEHASTLAVPDKDAFPARVSTDVASSRRNTGPDEQSARDRFLQKLDIHRRSGNNSVSQPQIGQSPNPSGGLANLITASHNVLPLAPPPMAGTGEVNRTFLQWDDHATTLAPSSLANPPSPTSLSRTAVTVSGEKGIGLGRADSTGGMPSGMMANLWGSTNWGFVNRLEREDSLPLSPTSRDSSPTKRQPSPSLDAFSSRRPQAPAGRHRQTLSVDSDVARMQLANVGAPHVYPSYYPRDLQIQDAQFRLLFPDVKPEEPLLMVFRTTWNPNDQQEFPGRAYITAENLHFYSHYLGLVLTTVVPLYCISDVTAAQGRDCDFLFLHTIPSRGSNIPGRITLKTFLEPLRLLQKRISFLVKESTTTGRPSLETIFKILISMETESQHPRSPSSDSGEEQIRADSDPGIASPRHRHEQDIRAPIYIDKDLDVGSKGKRKDATKFRLPTNPVQFVLAGNLHLSAEKELNISTKALFHVIFGDKSAVWQLLLYERSAVDIKQGPWTTTPSRLLRRDLQYRAETADVLGRSKYTTISDYQIIEVLNDHLCYVVTDKRSPWHLPFRRSFMLVSKIVITFVSKSKSKLAVYTNVEWLRSPPRIMSSQ